MQHIVTKIITETFESEIKRNQSENANPVAMKVTFDLSIDYSKEDGYRTLDMLIYAPMNYVGVIVRENWNVVSLSDIDNDNDCLKPDCDYVKGTTYWLYASYHDSCWRTDGVSRVIQENKERIISISPQRLSGWYEKVAMTPKLLTEFNNAISRDTVYKNDKFYVPGKFVFKF